MWERVSTCGGSVIEFRREGRGHLEIDTQRSGTVSFWFFGPDQRISGLRVHAKRKTVETRFGWSTYPGETTRNVRDPEIARMLRGIRADPNAPIEPLLDYLAERFPEAADFFAYLTTGVV